MYKTIKKRKQGKPPEENNRAHAAINGAVELEIGAKQLPVVVRDRLVHRTDDGGSEAEFCEHENAEDRAEESVQPEVRRPEEPKEQRAVQERKKKPDAARCGIRDHIALYVLLEVEFHLISQWPSSKSPVNGFHFAFASLTMR